jgi:predicted amidohydrolase
MSDKQAASKQLRVANVAMLVDRDPVVNRNRMADMVETIMQDDPRVELVFFGEMILGWYQPWSDPAYHRHISEPRFGKTMQLLAASARKHHIYICFGISEIREGELFNSQILLNPQGEIQAVHQKCNLKGAELEANYQPGHRMATITNIKGAKTGIVICSDTASFRTMWKLIKSRLDLILVSLADDDEDDFVTKFQGRLFDAWVVTANRYGEEGKKHWPGLIVVTDPYGEIRCARQAKEQYSINELLFIDRRRILRGLLRNVWVKMRLMVHVFRNLKRALSYL